MNKQTKYNIIIIALVLLIIYTLTMGYVLYNMDKKIKELYLNIEKKELLLSKMTKEKNIYLDDKKNLINNIDLKSDNSITKFVNSSVSFNNKLYVPKNLVPVKGDYIYDKKGNQIVREETEKALDKMAKSFYLEFNKKIVVISGYRSYNYQKGIKNRGCPDNLCAKAGFSEHQSGLTIDLWEASTNKQFLSKIHLQKYYKWLDENAHTFGFHNTYQKGLQVDGYDIEPWHWRYLGAEFATHLKDNNLTIAEFYTNKEIFY